MALIGRLFVILFAFLAACLVAGIIAVGAVLFPEFSDFAGGPIDQDAINIVLGSVSSSSAGLRCCRRPSWS